MNITRLLIDLVGRSQDPRLAAAGAFIASRTAACTRKRVVVAVEEHIRCLFVDSHSSIELIVVRGICHRRRDIYGAIYEFPDVGSFVRSFVHFMPVDERTYHRERANEEWDAWNGIETRQEKTEI